MAKVSASAGAVFLLGRGEEQELPRWRSERKCLQKEIADAHTVPGLTSESDSTRCGRAVVENGHGWQVRRREG